MDEILEIFRRNFPYVSREERTLLNYNNADLYTPGQQQRVLIAVRNGKIVGTLIVSVETEAEGVGNVGCTCVASTETHQGIATNMVKLGTRYLKDIGLKQASLSYTYSNLDVLYGASGYEITTYYFMGEKVVYPRFLVMYETIRTFAASKCK